MNKFKVGDKVRYTRPSHLYSCGLMAEGQVSTITSAEPRTGFPESPRLTLKEFGDFTWAGDSFEVVHPHKWAKEIKAWADGAQIEYRDKWQGIWHPWKLVVRPGWLTHDMEYRVYQEPKPDVVGYMGAFCPNGEMSPSEAMRDGVLSYASLTRTAQDNIKCTFDGETGKLKAVEILS